MNRFCFTARLVASILSVVLVGAVGYAAAPSTRSLAPIRLRGYGELSAKYTSGVSAQGETLSSLVISCESEAKAGLLLAKFVSDLHLLGDIRDDTLSVAGLKVPVFTVPRQGVVCAFRNGKVVNVLASPTVASLTAGLTSLKNKLAGAELAPRSKVPMFLDAWDKHGFGFYYWPFQQPKGVEWRNYDMLAEFDWAKRCNESGLVIWIGKFVTKSSKTARPRRPIPRRWNGTSRSWRMIRGRS